MARGINKVILIGNLGKDPEIKFTPSGQQAAEFTLATSESWTDKEGHHKSVTEWHRVVAWRRLAEICGQYLKKGSKVYIEGSLKTRSWEDANGQKRYMTEIVARDMQMLDGKGDDAGAGGRGEGHNDFGSPPGNDFDAGGDNDLPFS